MGQMGHKCIIIIIRLSDEHLKAIKYLQYCFSLSLRYRLHNSRLCQVYKTAPEN